ncbi:hypothetical protein J1N09_11920 [Aureitalea sp. L0-47]|uniref:hypothetical protein n=1 Tax=Aureitalea sp. L0-47 TaxID=2816962 RepID=UPI002237DD5F|nr:hypothetical protein [Aureitalea sp. L0-47]MCW5520552.1 hypothetical protein [Aureitalea sp. L0-47]
MKKTILLIGLFITCISISFAQVGADPNAPVWGLYASGVGERLSPCMDPCWVTYGVAMTTDPNIVANLEYGTMAPIVTGVTWAEATAQQRRFGRYFDDEPDGTWKCTPCDVPQPDLSCAWSSTYGKIHWGEGYYGSTTKTISGKLFKKEGVWVYEGTWGRTNSSRSGKVVFTFTSATSFKGYWTEGNSGKNTTWTGSGDCE